MRFIDLQQNFPNELLQDLYKNLGGEWPTKINDPAWRNTCCVRISISLNKSGHPIPNAKKEAITGDGKNIIIKVLSMKKHLESSIGLSTWGMSKQPGIPITKNDLPNFSGIIAYHVGWDDATGHFDLWTGNSFVGSGNFEDIFDGFAVEIWRID